MISRKIFRVLSSENKKFTARAIRWSRPSNTTMQITQQRLPPATVFTMMGILGFIKKEKQTDEGLKSRDILLAKADALFDQSKYENICELLDTHRDSRDVEILWRISRALYNMSKTAPEAERKKMIYEAYDLIATAISIDNDHFAVHKWMAVLLDAKSSYEGIKARLQQLHTVKQHMLRASELNPKDATTLYMLGSWCFEIASLAWYQRKIAATLFGEPPKTSYEEALTYFLAAESVDPNFYSQNLLMLGKTCLKLQKKEEALTYLKLASDFIAKNDDDHEAKREALKLLNELK